MRKMLFRVSLCPSTKSCPHLKLGFSHSEPRGVILRQEVDELRKDDKLETKQRTSRGKLVKEKQ